MITEGAKHAFLHLCVEDGTILLDGGLSKREAFAMAALQGLLANPFFAQQLGESSGDMASAAAYHADELLQRLSLNQEPRT